ncbi:MAG: S8 family serine peptidase [Gammaproteobacteria bacterium]|nr:S8 family serine peptidase [Gammaproteobacteria bacterium]
MMRLSIVVLLAAIASAGVSQADDSSADAGTRILVTFADPGMSNAARAGPVRPGYSRRSASYLVSFNVKRAANRIAKEFNLRTIDEWPIVALKVHCLVYEIAAGVSVEQLLARLQARPEVDSAQLLHRFEVSGALARDTADPYSTLQHNLDTLELAAAHTWSRGAGTSVTIIDTGADLDHPELKTQIRNHRDFVTDDDVGFTADAHGTAIAGVIGASANNGVGIVGVAPATELTILKACWHARSAARAVCNSFTLAKALSHAVESDTDVINLSLAGPSDPLLSRLVDFALQRGIIVVAASPIREQVGFPADIHGVIVVGADNSSGPQETLHHFVVNAPGDEILVPVPGGGYDYASGSSLSAAHVSGVVALLIAKQSDLGRDHVSALLADSRTAAGRSINACRALARLLQRSGCRDDSAVTQSLQR